MSSGGSATNPDELARMAAGDNVAWECFVRRWGAKVLAWCLSSGLKTHDADLVCQDVLQKLFLALKNNLYSKDRGRFRTWFRYVAYNTIKDFRGKLRNRDVTGSAAGALLDEQVAPVEPDPSELAESMADTESKLEEFERRVKEYGVSNRDWWMYVEDIQGKTRAELSKKYGLALQTVSNVLHDVRKVVKELRQENDNSP